MNHKAVLKPGAGAKGGTASRAAPDTLRGNHGQDPGTRRVAVDYYLAIDRMQRKIQLLEAQQLLT